MSTETDIKWALDLLEPDPNYEQNLLSKYYTWITCPLLAISGTAYANYMQGRPIYASLPRYGITLAASFIIAKALSDAKFHREASRDAVLRHYIKLHPEDFPPPEKKKWADVFEAWVPCR